MSESFYLIAVSQGVKKVYFNVETNQKRYPDLGSKASWEWNFPPRSQFLSLPLAPQGRVGEDPGNEVVEFLHSFRARGNR